MPRNRKRQANGSAWYRKHDNGWYATVDGKRVRLCDSSGRSIKGKERRADAELAVARRKLDLPVISSSSDVTVAVVAEAYLNHLAATASRGHVYNSTRTLNDFCSFCGALPAMQLKKRHVRQWVDQHTTWKSDNTKRDNLTIVIAALNHAVKEEELLPSNPIAGLKKPAGFARVTFFKQDEIDELIAYWNRPAKWKAVSLAVVAEYFEMLLLTGARPFSELAKVTADNIHEMDHGLVIRIKAGTDEHGEYRHKSSRKTGKDRTIYLCPEGEKKIELLVDRFPRGSGIPLFRTPRGKSWTRVSGVGHFCNAKKTLGWDEDSEKRHLSFYTCRHTFARHVLSGYRTGQPATLETLAGLMGNTPKICWDHYANWCEEYNAPLLRAIGREKRPMQD